MKRQNDFFDDDIVRPDGVRLRRDLKTLVRVPETYAGAFAIPDSVELVLPDAFSRCKNITALHIGKNATRLSSYSLKPLSFLACYTVASENTHFIAEDELLFTHGPSKTLISCPQKKAGTIDLSLHRCTALSSNAFFRCELVTEIRLGNMISDIGNHAFFGCVALTTLTIPESVQTIGIFAFKHCPSLQNVQFVHPHIWFTRDRFCSNKTALYGAFLFHAVHPEKASSIDSFRTLVRHIPGRSSVRKYMAGFLIPSKTVNNYLSTLKHTFTRRDIETLTLAFTLPEEYPPESLPYISIPHPFRKGMAVTVCKEERCIGVVTELKDTRAWKERDKALLNSGRATFADSFITVRFVCSDGSSVTKKLNPLCLEKA